MKGISRARDALYSSSGDQFQTVVGILLDPLVEQSALTKRLGRLDQAGVDAYRYDANDGSIELVIQCKGFELVDFGASQLAQCRKEIAKYKSKGIKTQDYWLVINRYIKDNSTRMKINDDLSGLVSMGLSKRAVLLDIEGFLKKIKELANLRLAQWATNKRKEVVSYYTSRMRFINYMGDVPFSDNSSTENGLPSNPVKYMLNDIDKFLGDLPLHQTGRFRKAPKFLLISGFGFGKTSALQSLAQEWSTKGGHLIYAPAPLLGDEAFVNSAGLSNALLQFLIPEDADLNELTRRIFRDTLRETLSRSSDWILLVDGLDENPAIQKPGSISSLWGNLRDLGISAALSVRDELISIRHTEFSSTDPATEPAFSRLKLLSWPDTLILQFLEAFAKEHAGTPSIEFDAFRQLVQRGAYEQVYGDIPRRPLFLGMIAEDAWSGQRPERHLHRLYGKYFRQKFLLDRETASAFGSGTRPSRIVEMFGIDEAIERLVLIMQDAAAHMAMNENSSGEKSKYLSQQDAIAEATLVEIGRAHGIEFLLLEDLVMHSLLQPSGRDRISRQRLVRFAHRSYQDWFFARYLAATESEEHLRETHLGLSVAAARFLDQMRDDLRTGGDLP